MEEKKSFIFAYNYTSFFLLLCSGRKERRCGIRQKRFYIAVIRDQHEEDESKQSSLNGEISNSREGHKMDSGGKVQWFLMQ
mmetsp:Transcript_5902/g.10636  ORF Transcript_5902/g.10636 Transcript_5902/m.10636 type:complete len:81 (-) Transcript_5902:1802-2044(-)